MIFNIVMITLLVLLAAKELAGASQSRFGWQLNRALNMAILPLAVLFVMILILTVTEILG